MGDFPAIDNPFFRESLRPLQATTQHIRDKRYKPTVEAIYLKRSQQPETVISKLPEEGKIVVPIIEGKPGDPNRHQSRLRDEEAAVDEFFEFKGYSKQYEDLLLRIQAIRNKSQLYPIWASDKPSIPTSISRKFGELNQQLFSLKKCFVSPEEIMLDNAATIIQNFFRAKLRHKYFLLAMKSVDSFKRRELSACHRNLNSWMAQMEYADSRAQQFRFRGLSRISRFSCKFWQKWSERESIITNRMEQKASEFYNRLVERRNKQSLSQWFRIATGPRSRKSMREWRLSMVPKMKQALEKSSKEAPQVYQALVSAYLEMKFEHSFLFNFFIGWHSRVRSKSLRETVGNRNAFLLYKKRIQTWSFKSWLDGVRKTKEFLGTPEKWKRYISLSRSQHKARMSLIRIMVEKWHDYAHSHALLKKRRNTNKKKQTELYFSEWRKTVLKHREMKMQSVQVWKRYIQNPAIAVFRAWKVYSIKKKTRRQVAFQLAESHNEWRSRVLIEIAFGKWQTRFIFTLQQRSSVQLEKRKWDLQRTKQITTQLSSDYSKARDTIVKIEDELSDITKVYIQKEDVISQLEEISTTWRIALHTMKMELLRLSITVDRCSSPRRYKKRRYSDEDHHERLHQDDRYGEETQSRLNVLQLSNRITENWKRRCSDPEIEGLPLSNVKPPLDENIVQLLSIENN